MQLPDKSSDDVREEWIRSAEVLLGVGKGHMGIITFLRSKGLDPEKAKRVSFDIFDEAKKRLVRSQRWYRLAAWFFIGMGFLMLPLVFVFKAPRIGIAAGVPMIGGVVLLGKLVNPSRLPED